jgi:hypothetical protein
MSRLRFLLAGLAAISVISSTGRAVAQFCPWAAQLNQVQNQQTVLQFQQQAAQQNQALMQQKQQMQWNQVMPQGGYGNRGPMMLAGQLQLNLQGQQAMAVSARLFALQVRQQMMLEGYLSSLQARQALMANLCEQRARQALMLSLARLEARPALMANLNLMSLRVRQATRPNLNLLASRPFAGLEGGMRPQNVARLPRPVAPVVAKQPQLAMQPKQPCGVTTKTQTTTQISLTATCMRCHTSRQSTPNNQVVQRFNRLPDSLMVRPVEVPWQALLQRREPVPVARLVQIRLPHMIAQPAPQPLPVVVAQAPVLQPLPQYTIPSASDTQARMVERSDGKATSVLARKQDSRQNPPTQGPSEHVAEARDLLTLPDPSAPPASLGSLPATVFQDAAGGDSETGASDGRALHDGLAAANAMQEATRASRGRDDLQMPVLALPATVLQLDEREDDAQEQDGSEPEDPSEEILPLPSLAVQPPSMPPVAGTVFLQ